MVNPVKPTPESLAHAKKIYGYDCAICHGANGDGKGDVVADLKLKMKDYTDPAALKDLTDGELFYIIQDGIRLTGMPAWGNGTARDEEDSWKLVHFIRHLPQITLEEKKAMEKMNPKSADELAEEQEEERFLRGEDSHETTPEHHHH